MNCKSTITAKKLESLQHRFFAYRDLKDDLSDIFGEKIDITWGCEKECGYRTYSAMVDVEKEGLAMTISYLYAKPNNYCEVDIYVVGIDCDYL